MNEPIRIRTNDRPRNRSTLISMLLSEQEQKGFLSPKAIRMLADHCGLTDNEVYGFASFFSFFRFSPDTPTDSKNTPSVAVASNKLQNSSAVQKKSSGTEEEAFSVFYPETGQAAAVTRFFDTAEEIQNTIRKEGCIGLERAMAGTPQTVEEIVVRSGLKEAEDTRLSCEDQWRLCRRSSDAENFLIGLAAGNDPVSLAQRALLEKAPHAVLEGMLIAGYAVHASHGILYVDGRSPLAFSRLQMALEQMQASGYLGTGIRGSDFDFHIQLIGAAGPIPCGDAARVISVLQGRRPESCHTPSGFQQHMFDGHPTVVHSVETLAKLSSILREGGDWYANLGINGHKGTKLMTLAGSVRRPGLVEVPLGSSLREIIDEVGGGLSEGKTLKAVQVGGPTSGWIAAGDLNVVVGREALAAAGTCLGSGSIVVASSDACAVDLARKALSFASLQSCGHCNFCREGTRQMSEILHDIARGRGKPEDLQLLDTLSEGLQIGSSCELGRTAPDAYRTTFQHFHEEYDTHLKKKRCLSGFCQKPKRDGSDSDTRRQDGK